MSFASLMRQEQAWHDVNQGEISTVLSRFAALRHTNAPTQPGARNTPTLYTRPVGARQWLPALLALRWSWEYQVGAAVRMGLTATVASLG
jgi:hypothetical protein